MANILLYSGTNDGYCASGLGTFASARSHAGSIADSNNNYDVNAIHHTYYSGRGTHTLRRAFFEFDTSDIDNAPSYATLQISGVINGDGDVIAVRSEQGGTLAAGDFNSFPAAVTALGNSDGSGAGTLAGVSNFTYSAEVTTWSTTTYTYIQLNSLALSDMATLDLFKVCIMNHDRDYLDIVATSTEINGLRWAEVGGIRRPTLSYTQAVPATFFGANF